MSVLVVTGTDTGVGKTITVAALAARALAQGRSVAVVKAAQTGDDDDAGVVRTLSGVEHVETLARYPEPLAPAAAARRAGVHAIGAAEIAAAVAALDHDLVLVEGAGGVLVHFDDAGSTIADVAALLGAPAVVVARAALGTLNHTALTCEALRARQVTVAGVIIGAWPADPGLAERLGRDDLPRYAGAPLLGALPEHAGQLAPHHFRAQAHDWIPTEDL